jgi:hypothetical protein
VNLGSIADAQAQKLEVDAWSSENGQKCVMKNCGEYCTAGKEVLAGEAKSCKGGKTKPICCPPDAVPQCRWRGGESGKVCHGQCHKAEVTLFYDRNGDGSACLKPGLKAFCCTGETFKGLIDSCYYHKCGQDCPGNTDRVAQKHDPRECDFWSNHRVLTSPPEICAYSNGGKGPQHRNLCCPKDSGITNCHWVGKGGCDDNMCSE